jgi:hypothetical protein
MKMILPLLIVYLSSQLMSGCMHRAPSLKMLEVRADYDGKEKEEAAGLRLGDNQALNEVIDGMPVRTAPQVANIWIFPEEMAQKSYFWGAWVTVEVEGGKWEIEKQDRRFPEKPKSKDDQKLTPKAIATGGKS